MSSHLRSETGRRLQTADQSPLSVHSDCHTFCAVLNDLHRHDSKADIGRPHAATFKLDP